MKIPMMLGNSGNGGLMARKSSNVAIIPKHGAPRLSYINGKNK